MTDRRRPKRAHISRPPLTDHEAAVILANIERADPRAASIGSLILRVGFRLSDFFALHREDVDFERSRIRCRDGKGGSDTWLPLSADASRHLRRHLEDIPASPEALVFPGAKVRRRASAERRERGARSLTDAGITKIWFRSLAVGLKCSPHRGRHWFATALAKAGVPVPTISRLMRHSAVSITDAYLHSSDAEAVEAIARLDTVLGGTPAELAPVPTSVERPHLEVLQHDPAAPAWAPIADDEDTPVRGEADGNIRGVLAILEWPEEATEPAAIYIASGDTPGELAGLVELVLEEYPQTWDDPAQLAAALVEQVASAGLPYRLSAAEPAFDGRIIQVDPEARTVALFSAGSAGQPGRRWRSWSFEEVTTSSEWGRAFEAY